ncbi:MAG: glycosyltransferase family 4 protein [Muribaculaceae bacterium]|nr:glycosyltransferase family 4 protein [Muribaculaceae bacterium]
MKTVAINLISFSSDHQVGTLVFTKRLMKEWLNTFSPNYNIIIYIQSHLSPEVFNIPNLQNITIIKVPKFKNSIHRIFFEQTIFYKYIKKSDIFFSPSLSMPLFVQSYKIVTFHDMIPYINKKKYGFIRNAYVKLFSYLYAKYSNKIITVSENSKNDIIRFLKCDNSKIDIVYNFISRNEIISNEHISRIRTHTDIDLSTPYFLTVCTLQPGKNIERLIDAFSIFNKDYPTHKLFIVGGYGWGYETILKKIKESSSSHNIVLLGYRDDAQLQMLYKYCIGVVYVSLYEGFGIPPLEGFMFNKLCVASNNSSLPEVVGEAGILVDPLDINDIARGLKNIMSSNNLLINIPKQLSKFDPTEQAKKFDNIIKKSLS